MSCDMGYSGVDAVVHLAAIPSPGQTNSSEQFRVNTMRCVVAAITPRAYYSSDCNAQHLQRTGSMPKVEDHKRDPRLQ